MLHGNSPESRIEFYRKLLEIEARPGQRLLVSKFPSILVSTDISKIDQHELMDVPDQFYLEMQDLLKRRKEIFQRNLEQYGERSIHSVSSIARFLNSSFRHNVSVVERRARVRGLLGRLRGSTKFQVALADVEPEVEIAIKSTEAAMMRGTSRELSNHPQTIHCGPRYLFWVDKEVEKPWGVLSFFFDFEDEWQKLEDAGRANQEYVIHVLQGMLTEAETSD
jgi:hypothetical protein